MKPQSSLHGTVLVQPRKHGGFSLFIGCIGAASKAERLLTHQWMTKSMSFRMYVKIGTMQR
eukprot:scaffold180251_cov21-Tisochrysis_lutea.AAC.1